MKSGGRKQKKRRKHICTDEKWKHMSQWLGDSGIILLDLNNIRGKVGFPRADVLDLCAVLAQWTRENDLKQQVIIEVDHGPSVEYFYRSGVGMSFAGTKIIADDLIVMDVDYFVRQENKRVLVVTSDMGLKDRCKRVMSMIRQEGVTKESKLRIVDSLFFSGLLEGECWKQWREDPAADGIFLKEDKPRPWIRRPETTQDRCVQAQYLYETLQTSWKPPKTSSDFSVPVMFIWWWNHIQARLDFGKAKDNADNDTLGLPDWDEDYSRWVQSGRPDAVKI